MAVKVQPYRRGLRPQLPESFPPFVDAELQRISTALTDIAKVLEVLDARIAALEAR